MHKASKFYVCLLQTSQTFRILEICLIVLLAAASIMLTNKTLWAKIYYLTSIQKVLPLTNSDLRFCWACCDVEEFIASGSSEMRRPNIQKQMPPTRFTDSTLYHLYHISIFLPTAPAYTSCLLSSAGWF